MPNRDEDNVEVKIRMVEIRGSRDMDVGEGDDGKQSRSKVGKIC